MESGEVGWKENTLLCHTQVMRTEATAQQPGRRGLRDREVPAPKWGPQGLHGGNLVCCFSQVAVVLFHRACRPEHTPTAMNVLPWVSSDLSKSLPGAASSTLTQ